MLQNAYLFAKIGADTAENELHFAEILPIGVMIPVGVPSARSSCADISAVRQLPDFYDEEPPAQACEETIPISHYREA